MLSYIPHGGSLYEIQNVPCSRQSCREMPPFDILVILLILVQHACRVSLVFRSRRFLVWNASSVHRARV